MVPSCCRHRRRTLAVVFALALCVLAVTSTARGQEPPPQRPDPAEQAAVATEPSPSLVTFGANIGIFSAFVWRGTISGEDPVIQPSAWLGIGPLTVTSWSNTFLPSSGMSYSEHDLLVDYSVEFKGATLSLGWINYAFPKETTGRHTNEFYAMVAGNQYLEPKLQIYHDVNEGHGTYAALAVGHAYGVGSSKLTVTPSISVGYNWHQWTDYVGFSDVTMTVSASIPTPIRHLALQPIVGYLYGIDTSVFSRRFYGGVTLSVE